MKGFVCSLLAVFLIGACNDKGGKGGPIDPNVSGGPTEPVLVFDGMKQNGKYDLYMVRPEDEMVQVTKGNVTDESMDNENGLGFFETISRDFRRQVFHCSDWQKFHFCLADVEKGEVAPIFEKEGFDIEEVIFSPDGKKLLVRYASKQEPLVPQDADSILRNATILNLETGEEKEISIFSKMRELISMTGIAQMGWTTDNIIWAVSEKNNGSQKAVFYDISLDSLELINFPDEKEGNNKFAMPWSPGKVYFNNASFSELGSEHALYLFQADSRQAKLLAQFTAAGDCGHNIVLLGKKNGEKYDFTLFNAEKGEVKSIGSVEGKVLYFACSQEGKIAAVTVGDEKMIRIFSLTDASILNEDVGSGDLMGFSPNGDSLVFGKTPTRYRDPWRDVTVFNRQSKEKKTVGNIYVYGGFVGDESILLGRFTDTKMYMYQVATNSMEELPSMKSGGVITPDEMTKYFAYILRKDGGIANLFIWNRAEKKAINIPGDFENIKNMAWIQVPVGAYEKWKKASSERSNGFSISAKENRAPSCVVVDNSNRGGPFSIGENDVWRGIVKIEDEDYEDKISHALRDSFGMLTEADSYTTFSKRFETTVVQEADGRTKSVSSAGTLEYQADGRHGIEALHRFHVTDSAGASGECEVRIGVPSRVPAINEVLTLPSGTIRNLEQALPNADAVRDVFRGGR